MSLSAHHPRGDKPREHARDDQDPRKSPHKQRTFAELAHRRSGATEQRRDTARYWLPGVFHSIEAPGNRLAATAYGWQPVRRSVTSTGPDPL